MGGVDDRLILPVEEGRFPHGVGDSQPQGIGECVQAFPPEVRVNDSLHRRMGVEITDNYDVDTYFCRCGCATLMVAS